MTVLIVVETAVLVVLSILVVGLLRSYATVLQRLHRLDGGDVSAAAPPFRTADGVIQPPQRRPADVGPIVGRDEWAAAHDVAGVGLYGEVVSARTVAVPHDTVIVFLSSGCSGCTGFWEQLADRRILATFGDGRMLVVTKGPEDESITLLRDLCPAGTDLVMSSTAWADYAVPGSPYVVVVDGQTGRVKGEGSGTSLSQLSGLIHQAVGDRDAGETRYSVNKPRKDAEREVDVDRVLLAAGIGPGHPSLYRADAAGSDAAAPVPHGRPPALPPTAHESGLPDSDSLRGTP